MSPTGQDNDDDDDFGFDDATTHEGHLHQNGILLVTCLSTERAVMVSHTPQGQRKDLKDNLHSLPHQNISCEYSLERSIHMIYSGVKIIQN